MIVTGELVDNVGSRKFVPIVYRDAEFSECIPVFLKTRLAARLSSAGEPQDEWEQLLRTLHNVGPKKPPRGSSPFAESVEPPPATDPASTPGPAFSLAPVLVASATTPETSANADELAKQTIAEAGALLRGGRWNEYRKYLRRLSDLGRQRATAWQASNQTPSLGTKEDRAALASEFSNCYADFFAGCLTGITSDFPEVNDQAGGIAEVLDIRGWNRSGLTILVDAPFALGSLFQALHGAACVSNDGIEEAWKLLNSQPLPGLPESTRKLYEFTKITFFVPLLGGDSVETVKWHMSTPNRWTWVEETFGTKDEFESSLLAYYTVASLADLSVQAAKLAAVMKEQGKAKIAFDRIRVPILAVPFSEHQRTTAIRKLVRHREKILKLVALSPLKNFDAAVVRGWAHHNQRALSQTFPYAFDDYIPYIARDVLGVPLGDG